MRVLAHQEGTPAQEGSPASARNSLYQLVIAQMALRALRAVFTADRGGLVRTVARNGYVDTINTATGKPARWCLINTKVDRDQFDDLDLAYVKWPTRWFLLLPDNGRPDLIVLARMHRGGPVAPLTLRARHTRCRCHRLLSCGTI